MPADTPSGSQGAPTLVTRWLGWIERLGNKLPDPALLFVLFLGLVWLLSALLAGYEFSVPSTQGPRVLSVQNQLTGASLAVFLSDMVKNFTGFAPLGVVLVALLGVGVAERTGFINAALECLLSLTPRAVLSAMLLLVALVSHAAADAGYVLVIPLGGVIFHAAGRHPLPESPAPSRGCRADSPPTSFRPESIPCCKGSHSKRRRSWTPPGR
jgi:p-aminobenzoyl-glutamate transporter AbgT